MTEKCTCDQRLPRFGEFTQPVKFCDIHGNPYLLSLLDLMKAQTEQIAELQRKVDLIYEVDQKRARRR